MLEYDLIDGTRVNLVENAISILQHFEPEEGFYLAFSGGKDSVVCKKLLDMSGCKYDAHYNPTTVDPPELMQFIRKEYPDVIWERPKKSMRTLIIENKMPPTGIMRYCCEELKEGGVWEEELLQAYAGKNPSGVKTIRDLSLSCAQASA